ncbi:MAG TPA: pentapeptide repeat-containing protein, partial [Rhodospirillaceae bacterium]|nr:pentapeptide repeat-containing protein [Rhodospirillaceae bacterium]
KLNQADFTGASLRKADFEDAEFHGAKFHGADICGVNLTRWFVDERQLLGAVGDLKTKLPRGFTMRTADCTLLVSKGNEMVPQAQIKG